MNGTVLMLAGEASGDLHGAKLASALFRIAQSEGGLRLEGVGGKLMEEAGVHLLADIRELGVVGLVEVLGHWGSIWRVYRMIRERLYQAPPDLLVLIDYPDFNLRVAKIARKVGVPVVYYISPQVWAWRSSRVRQIAGLIDKMLVIFPFEKPLYDAVGVDCEFVGHPLLDDLPPLPSRTDLRSQMGLGPLRPTVGLFPGSRRQEVFRMLPTMLSAMSRLKGRMPDLQLVLSVAPSLDLDRVESPVASWGGGTDSTVICGQPEQVIAVSDALVVASGTATLQAAIREVPMVIVYKVSGLTYLLGRLLICTEHIGMPNIVAQERVVPELIQHRMTPEAVEREIYRILDDRDYCERMKKGLSQVRARLGSAGASMRAARIILDFLTRGARIDPSSGPVTTERLKASLNV